VFSSALYRVVSSRFNHRNSRAAWTDPDASLEYSRLRSRPHHDLVAEHEGEVDPVGGHLDLVIAAGDAREHRPVLRQRLHGVEHERANPDASKIRSTPPSPEVEETPSSADAKRARAPQRDRVEIRAALPSECVTSSPRSRSGERARSPMCRADHGAFRPPHAEPALESRTPVRSLSRPPLSARAVRPRQRSLRHLTGNSDPRRSTRSEPVRG